LDLSKDFFYGYSTLAVSDQHPPISTKYQANISPSCIVHKTLLIEHLSFMNLCIGIILFAYQALQAVMMNITTSPKQKKRKKKSVMLIIALHSY